MSKLTFAIDLFDYYFHCYVISIIFARKLKSRNNYNKTKSNISLVLRGQSFFFQAINIYATKKAVRYLSIVPRLF